MLRFKLVDNGNGFYLYEYYPEDDRSVFGVIRLGKNGESEIVTLSPGDEFKSYAFHAISYISRNLGEKEGIVAWY